VGTLTGGAADCANPVNDYFTKFDYAWDYYDAPDKQLRQWLDPAGTGTMKLNGFDPLAATAAIPPEEPRYRIYPNPAGERLHVETELSGRGIAEISVFHISGTLLLKSHAVRAGTCTLDVSQLDPGIYILRIKKEQHVANQRFIIAR
jgi:hypothetical protein